MDNKPKCEYGNECYRKNPDHLKNYYHPPKQEVKKDAGPAQKKLKLERKAVQTTLNFFTKGNGKTPGNTNQLDQKTAVAADAKVQKPSPDKTNSRIKYVIEESDSDDSADVAACADTSSINKDTIALSRDEYNSIIETMFLVNMPQDFYQFYEFCKSCDEKSPKYALSKCGLELVGPFEVLTGHVNVENMSDPVKYLCHWRYYYDPPEFQTVLKGEKGSHWGYWRDDPNETPVLVASNNNQDCVINLEGCNLFTAVSNHLVNYIKKCDPFTKVAVSKIHTKLESYVKKNTITLSVSTSEIKERQKKVVTKTFHKFGIVVPVEKKTELGYRPLIETESNIKKMCKLIMEADNTEMREKLYDNLQPLINAANIANDECDFGNSLELGIDLFCMGSDVFHNTIKHLLTTAYSLLNRPQFEQIISAHLKYRRRGNNLSVLSIK